MPIKVIRELRRLIQKKYKNIKVQTTVNRFKKKCKTRRKKGKYFIIQITRNPRGRGALVRFLSERTCILQQPVIISRYIKWHISSKFFLTKFKNEKVLSRISVIMSEQFAINHIPQQVYQSLKPVESKNVNLMYTCEFCNWKFTEQNYFHQHMLTHSEHLIVAEDKELEDGQYEILSEENEDFELANKTIEYPNDENEDQETWVIKNNLQKDNQSDHLCYACDKNFTRQDFLDYHIRIQHKEFECKYCPNVYRGEHSFKAHFKNHIDDNSTEDVLKGIDQNQDTLGRSCKKRSSSHISKNVKKFKDDCSHVAKDAIMLKCSYCKYECKIKSEIDEHVSLWHSNTINFKRYDCITGETFSCSICNLNFTKRFHLDRHVPIHTHQIFQCSKCQETFEFKKKFFNHLEVIHSGPQDKEFYNHFKMNSQLAVCFRCGFCRFAAKSRCTVDEHTYAEHYEEYSAKLNKDTAKRDDDQMLEELPRKELSGQIKQIVPTIINSTYKYKCRFCGNAFLTIGNRLRHEIDYHSSKGIVKKKNSESSMKQIIDKLTMEVSTTFIACPKCPQIFTAKSMFESHYNSHV